MYIENNNTWAFWERRAFIVSWGMALNVDLVVPWDDFAGWPDWILTYWEFPVHNKYNK